MTVDNSWLVNVSVAINTTVVPLPTFNNCLLIGIMPTQSSPYQSPPASWSGSTYQSYSSFAAISTDFSPLLTAAITAGDLLQANRFQWLLNDAQAFFAQSPNPTQLYIAAQSPTTSATNWTTYLTTLTNLQNNFYGFKISDLILANAYSTCVIQITTTSTVTLASGTLVTPETATASYTLLQPTTLTGTGTHLVTFYSTDASTAIPASTFTAISPTVSGVSAVTNTVVAVNGIPGVLTATTGLSAALTSQRSLNNQKKLFLDTLDTSQAQAIQTATGNQDLMICYHSLNLQPYNATTSASISAACLSKYFTNLFTTGIGLKTLSSMQLQNQIPDSTITNSNIGTPGVAGSSTNLIGWNNNVFAGIGAPPGIGLMQYGFMSSSTATTQVYLDQIVGADYVQFVTQSDLVTYIINQQPTGGIPYNDVGIQGIVNIFKGSMQKAVVQNIIQNPPNSSFSYYTYAQVQSLNPTAITNRIYNNLSFSGKFLSRIQRIAVNINLSL